MAMGAEAAKGCESFLCEQRIESNWRVLFTIKTTSSTQLVSPRATSGGSALEQEKQLGAGSGHARSFGRRRFFGGAVHFLLAGLANVNRALEPGAVLDGNSLANDVAPE